MDTAKIGDRAARTVNWSLVPVISGVFAVSLLLGSSGRTARAEEPGVDPAPRADYRVELDEKPEPQDPAQWIDGKFTPAVDLVETVLFYKLFAGERQFVQMDHVEHYVRPRGGKQSFERLDPNGEWPADSITEQEAEALSARGKLIAKGENPWQKGRRGDRLVEFVAVVIDNKGKYIRREHENRTVFTRLARDKHAKRDLLSGDTQDTLSLEAVEDLAARGWLKLNAEKEKSAGTGANANENPSYLHTEPTGGAPLVVLWLALGSVYFTLYMRGVNFWGFRHAIAIVRGRYDNPAEPGEVTHFQALSSALSATVGLGNIAGVTIAMTFGGPGAFFWMLACGLFGMTSKFVECTLGQKYRQVKPDGTVLGGPMQYLYVGLKELGLGHLGLVLSIAFALMCIFASFGGGNMFQANQSSTMVLTVIQTGDIEEMSGLNTDIAAAATAENYAEMERLQTEKESLQKKMDTFRTRFLLAFGAILAVAVAMVIIGGIKRIGAAAEKIVPTMCIMYVLACLWIILSHLDRVLPLAQSVFTEAFSGKAIGGGLLGVLVIGVTRAAFSNEAGVGSASIAHSAAKTREPVREGAVALLGPFIDTIVVCSMTALVILITGAWNNTDWVVNQGREGAELTSLAFGKEISWFPYVLGVAVVLFAYSTIISWSYYGERCWERLFGARSTFLYKILFVVCAFVGPIIDAGAVLAFSDMMILSMAFPNILGLVLLSPKVRRDLLDYWRRYKAGEFQTFK